MRHSSPSANSRSICRGCTPFAKAGSAHESNQFKGAEIIMIRPANKIASQPGEDIVSRSSDYSISGHVPPAILLRLTFGLFLLIVLMSVAQSGKAQGLKFSQAGSYPTGGNTLVTGDFNGDGNIDLVANNGNAAIALL